MTEPIKELEIVNFYPQIQRNAPIFYLSCEIYQYLLTPQFPKSRKLSAKYMQLLLHPLNSEALIENDKELSPKNKVLRPKLSQP